MPLNKGDKRTIDLLTPVIVTSVAGFYAYKRNKDWRVLLLVILAVFLLSYVIVSQITRRIYLAGPGPVPTGGCEQYDATGIVDALYYDIDEVMGTRDRSLYDQLLGMSDCQLKICYNLWNEKYFGKFKQSLPAAIADESAFWDSDFGAQQKALAGRFQRLNLS